MKWAPGLAALLLAVSAAFAGDDTPIRRDVEAALARGDRAAALALLDAFAKPDAPFDRAARVEAARVARDVVGGPEGDLRAAQILVLTLAEDRSDAGGAWTEAVGLRGRAVRREIDLVSAHALLTGLIRIYPDVIDYRKDVALVYRDGGLVDEARAEYSKILELAPSLTDVRYRLASLEEDSGRFEQALAIYDDLIRLHEKDPRPELSAYLSKGWMLLDKMRDCGAARQALEAGAAAANAVEPGLFRDEYLAKFDARLRALEQEEKRRESLRELRGNLDATLFWTGAAWAVLLGGGVWWLRRMKWV